MIYVCSLSRLHETVERSGARHIITLIDAATRVERPGSVHQDHHLFLGFNDITEPMDGLIHPSPDHVEEVLTFAERWDRATPLVVHCFAGISRSTACAYILACALSPYRDERDIARALRKVSASATPNRLFVAHADARLKRAGRMVAAIEEIGTGALASEGEPFVLEIG
jgi:predicted protein tyrosine phosphatase